MSDPLERERAALARAAIDIRVGVDDFAGVAWGTALDALIAAARAQGRREALTMAYNRANELSDEYAREVIERWLAESAEAEAGEGATDDR